MEQDHNASNSGPRRIIPGAIATVLFALAIGHGFFPTRFMLDWPTVALIALAGLVMGWRKVEAILPLVKRFKLGQAEIEMQARTEELAESVQVSERAAKPALSTGTAELSLPDGSTKSVELEILDLAALNKPAAMIRLAIELEREILSLQGMLGLRNQARTNTLSEALRMLKVHKAISDRIAASVQEFWEIRNGLLHGTSTFPDALLTSALDSGVRLLALIRSIPRPTYEVADPAVLLYKDKDLKIRISEYMGVRIETTLLDGAKMQQVFPAGRKFERGEIVSWDWDTTRKFGPAYVRDTNGEAVLAWSSSSAFIGQPERGRESAAAAQ